MRTFSDYSLALTGTLIESLLAALPAAEQELDVAQQKAKMLEEKSVIDEKTGLYNEKGYFIEVKRLGRDALHNNINKQKIAETAISRPTPPEHTLIVFFLDLDGFKDVNDKSGHDVGDDVLRAVGAAARKVVGRGLDIIGRFGGDEFGLAFVHNSVEGGRSAEEVALQKAEQLRALIQALEIKDEATGLIHKVTASIGVAFHAPQEEDPAAEIKLVKRADIGMYQAKAARGNCICIANEGDAMPDNPKRRAVAESVLALT